MSGSYRSLSNEARKELNRKVHATRVERKRRVIEEKGGRCIKCGYDHCIDALDFHHIDPKQKERSWMHMRCWGEERLQAELSKCILVCCNCHREIHAKLRGLPS